MPNEPKVEGLVERARSIAIKLRNVRCEGIDGMCDSAADLLQSIAAAHEAMATERNEALAAVTSAEQRAVNAEAEVAARIAEAVAQERDACAAMVDCGCPPERKVGVVQCSPNSGSRWTFCGEGNCAALDAAAIRARKDSTP